MKNKSLDFQKSKAYFLCDKSKKPVKVIDNNEFCG